MVEGKKASKSMLQAAWVGTAFILATVAGCTCAVGSVAFKAAQKSEEKKQAPAVIQPK